MVHQPFQPDQEVVLAHDASGALTGPGERGGTGSARIDTYTADTVRVHTSADADAWLVLSDTYYPGWTVTIDGQPAPLLRGDVLFRVVPIPGGEHEVQFTFDPPSVKLGLAVSLAALCVVVASWLLAGALQRTRRTT